MAQTSRVADDGHQRLIRIQRLWKELQAARRDPVKYEALAKRIRQEADAFLHALDSPDASAHERH